MKIHVTEKHIKKGVISDPWNCPIAIAIQKATGIEPTVTSEWYILDSVKFPVPKKVSKLPMPKKVSKFIDDFDQGKPVKPFNFVLKELQ